MKRVILTPLNWIEPNTFKNSGYLLARSGKTYEEYSIITENQATHRSAAKESAKKNTKTPNFGYIEMNNYAEDYVWDQIYPDIPESYKYANVATNTGLVLIFYSDSKKLIIYDLLVDNSKDKVLYDYKVKSPTFPRDIAETRRYSINNKGEFVMTALFKDDYGYYGIIDSMKTINIDKDKYNEESYANSEILNAAIGYLKHANMDTTVINQGFTFSTKRTFDYIILPSKKYFRTSGNVTIYGPNNNSVVCLDDDGIATTATKGNFWFIEEPFYTSDGTGFIILKYADKNPCILEVS